MFPRLKDPIKRLAELQSAFVVARRSDGQGGYRDVELFEIEEGRAVMPQTVWIDKTKGSIHTECAPGRVRLAEHMVYLEGIIGVVDHHPSRIAAELVFEVTEVATIVPALGSVAIDRKQAPLCSKSRRTKERRSNGWRPEMLDVPIGDVVSTRPSRSELKKLEERHPTEGKHNKKEDKNKSGKPRGNGRGQQRHSARA